MRRAAEVGPGRVAAVADEARVDHLEPAAAHEDRAAAAALGRLAGRVAVGEGEVLHGEPRVVLVLAVRGGPALRLVAGVHVEDAALAAAAERDLAAAVEHDLGPVGVADLRGRGHRDGDRVRPAVERDDAAGARPPSTTAAEVQLAGGAVADHPGRAARCPPPAPRPAPARRRPGCRPAGEAAAVAVRWAAAPVAPSSWGRRWWYSPRRRGGGAARPAPRRPRRSTRRPSPPRGRPRRRPHRTSPSGPPSRRRVVRGGRSTVARPTRGDHGNRRHRRARWCREQRRTTSVRRPAACRRSASGRSAPRRSAAGRAAPARTASGRSAAGWGLRRSAAATRGRRARDRRRAVQQPLAGGPADDRHVRDLGHLLDLPHQRGPEEVQRRRPRRRAGHRHLPAAVGRADVHDPRRDREDVPAQRPREPREPVGGPVVPAADRRLFIWYFKVQGALNEFWLAKGARAE